MRIKTKKRIALYMLLGVLSVSVVVGYYVINFPFGTNVIFSTNDLNDLYWDVNKSDNRFCFIEESESNRKKFRKVLPDFSIDNNIGEVSAMTNWVHQSLNMGQPVPDTDWNPYFLLKTAHKKIFFCDEYVALLVSALQSYGYTARVMHVSSLQRGGHFISEVWIPKINKWVMFDPLFNLHFELNNNPLSIREIHRLVRNSKTKKIKVSQGKVKKEELKFDNTYFNYFEFNELSLLLRTDFISRPNSLRGLILTTPQRFLLYKAQHCQRVPWSSAQILKNKVKILFLAFCVFMVGFLLCVNIMVSKGKEFLG